MLFLVKWKHTREHVHKKSVEKKQLRRILAQARGEPEYGLLLGACVEYWAQLLQTNTKFDLYNEILYVLSLWPSS